MCISGTYDTGSVCILFFVRLSPLLVTFAGTAAVLCISEWVQMMMANMDQW